MVYVPARTAAQVTEKGKQVSSARGVKFVRLEGEAAVFSVASGDYQFASSGE
jgi:alpha-L-rhamnosidase